jgi:DNA-binding transcriptional LysR family regulator
LCRTQWHDVAVELRQLEYFVAVAEHLHFGRAAEALSIGQPAVSQQIARLERELGVSLLDRTPRTVRLTAAGCRFLTEARAVLTAVERARAAAIDSAVGDSARMLRIGSSTGMGERLALVLASLSESAPWISTELVSAPTRARLERVAAGQLDAAFVRGIPSAKGVELMEVWQDQLLVALPASHELSSRDVVSLSDLALVPLRIVSRRLNPPLVDLVLDACAEAGYTPALADHPDSVEQVLAAIASGSPTWTVMYEPQARMINQARVKFLPTRPALVMPTSLAVRGDTTSRTVAPLLRACAAAASDGYSA